MLAELGERLEDRIALEAPDEPTTCRGAAHAAARLLSDPPHCDPPHWLPTAPATERSASSYGLGSAGGTPTAGGYVFKRPDTVRTEGPEILA